MDLSIIASHGSIILYAQENPPAALCYEELKNGKRDVTFHRFLRWVDTTLLSTRIWRTRVSPFAICYKLSFFKSTLIILMFYQSKHLLNWMESERELLELDCYWGRKKVSNFSL